MLVKPPNADGSVVPSTPFGREVFQESLVGIANTQNTYYEGHNSNNHPSKHG
jgi:hypothetical protein